MAEQLTLYTARICPYAQRAEIALAEVGAKYTRVEIGLQNKPEWYAPKVNPASKVPALTYGGPKAPPEQPSPESFKLAESLVILEFFADLFPNSNLLPKDPIQRARARFFIDAVSTKLSPGWTSFVLRGENVESFFAGLEAIQALLPDDGKTFAISDEFTIADAAVAPFLGRAFVLTKSDIGAYAPGEGMKASEVLNSPRFGKLLKYYKTIEARESFKSTFDEELIKDWFQKRLAEARAQKLAA